MTRQTEWMPEHSHVLSRRTLHHPSTDRTLELRVVTHGEHACYVSVVLDEDCRYDTDEFVDSVAAQEWADDPAVLSRLWELAEDLWEDEAVALIEIELRRDLSMERFGKRIERTRTDPDDA